MEKLAEMTVTAEGPQGIYYTTVYGSRGETTILVKSNGKIDLVHKANKTLATVEEWMADQTLELVSANYTRYKRFMWKGKRRQERQFWLA